MIDYTGISDHINRPPQSRIELPRLIFVKMKVYDDTFSGTKIYPGKVVSLPSDSVCMRHECANERFAPPSRVNYMYAATTKSSDSRMAKAKVYSSSARTLEGSPGLFSTGNNTRRVSQRSV